MDINNYKTLITDRLILKVLTEEQTPYVLDFLKNGRTIFEQYESLKAPLFYTTKFQKYILRTEYDAALKHLYLRYYVFLKDCPDNVIGTVSFGNVLPDPYVSCNIGYKINPACHNTGYGTEAVNAAIIAAYSYLNLHRINAYVQEGNLPSIRILEKSGFQLEGKCIKNLRINGSWTDHLLYGLINPDFCD